MPVSGGGPLAAAVASLNSNPNSNLRQPANFDWRNQMRRLSAALYDADPANPGRGHLSAYDDQQAAHLRDGRDSDRRRSELETFANQMGLDARERALLLHNPVMWLQLFGASHRQRMGVNPAAGLDPEPYE